MATDKIEIIVEAEVRKALGNLKKFDDQTGKMEKTQGSFFSKAKAGWIAVAAIMTGVVAVAFKKTISLASDFEEANGKFGVTFAGVSKQANAMRKELVSSFNLSTKAATELLSNTGDMLSGFGMSSDAALDMSGNVNKLAADLSSFANVPIEQASAALTKGIMGERESMKALGIAILETDVKQRLMLEGKDKLTGMALKQARAEVTLSLALEQSKNAIGDSARTSDSFANTMRKLRNIAQDLQVAIGQKLIKLIAPTIKEFSKFIKSAEGMKAIDQTIKGLVTGFILLKAVVGVAFEQIRLNIANFVDAMQAMSGFVTSILEGDFKGAWDSLKDNAVDIKDNYVGALTGIVDGVKDAAEQIKDVWATTSAAQIAGLDLIVDKEAAAAAKKIEIAEAEKQRKAKIAVVAMNFANDLATSGATIAQNILLRSGKDDKEAKRKAAVADKAFAVGKAALMIPLAIASVFAQGAGGVISKGVAAAIAGVTATANFIAVASTPLPKFAQGGFLPGTPALVGEQGPELFQPNIDGRVINNTETSELLESAGGGNTYIFNGIEDLAAARNELQMLEGRGAFT